MAEQAKALRTDRSIFGRVCPKPTPVNLLIVALFMATNKGIKLAFLGRY